MQPIPACIPARSSPTSEPLPCSGSLSGGSARVRILTTARATTPLLHPPQVPSDSPVEACLQVPEHEGPALQNSSLLLPSSVLFPRHPSRTAAREFPPVLCFSAHLSPTQSFPSSLPASPAEYRHPSFVPLQPQTAMTAQRPHHPPLHPCRSPEGVHGPLPHTCGLSAQWAQRRSPANTVSIPCFLLP